jgi:SAM-dependent methyltransferase
MREWLGSLSLRERAEGEGKLWKAACVAAFLCFVMPAAGCAQDLFSPYVPSDIDEVRRMLKMVGLRDGDVVYDLGSGDGRIVLEAARLNKTVRGRGIEIDEKLVQKSNEAAKANGVDGRVEFLHQNAFDADLREATVITMWLFPELMRMLRPKILAEARPGTRVVTRTWDLGGWKPDESDGSGWPVHVWVVPARIGGAWTWELPLADEQRSYVALIDQCFQMTEGVARVGNRRGLLDELKLSGDRISFVLQMRVEGVGPTRHQFEGRVKGDSIEGVVKVTTDKFKNTVELPWRATRSAQSSAYFAPTGVDAR